MDDISQFDVSNYGLPQQNYAQHIVTSPVVADPNQKQEVPSIQNHEYYNVTLQTAIVVQLQEQQRNQVPAVLSQQDMPEQTTCFGIIKENDPPCAIFCKIILLPVIVPLVILYRLFRCIILPAVKGLCKLCKWICEQIGELICCICQSIYKWCILPICKLIEKIFESIGKCISGICKCLWKYIKPCLVALIDILAYICKGIYAVIIKPIVWVCSQIGKLVGKICECVYSCFKAICSVIKEIFLCIHKYILKPIFDCIGAIAKCIWQVIKGILDCISKVITCIADFIWKIIGPPIKCIGKILQDIFYGIASLFGVRRGNNH